MRGRYTKHIYIGSQRIDSKLGDFDSYGADPRRVEKAGESFAGVKVNYDAKCKKSLDVVKTNYNTFEVPYYGNDNNDYVNGIGFCCNPSGDASSSSSAAKSAKSAGNDNAELQQFYYHPDHLGSSSYISNLDGEVVQHIEYVPFGEVFLEEKNAKWNTPYLFTSKELDKETGMYYFGARYQDPKLGIFISVDPLAEKYAGVSSYAYTLNNPIKFIDPDGRAVSDPPVIWMKSDSHSMSILNFGNGFKYKKGDNYFDLFAHANHQKIIGRDSNGKQVDVRTPKEFVALMSASSKEFKAAMEKGELLIVKLHACNTGADTDHLGNPIESSLGQRITAEYENIIIIAPDGKVVTSSGKDPKGKDESTGNAYEKGIFDRFDSTPNADGGQGSYRMFFKGKQMHEDSSVGLPKPPKPKKEMKTNNNCQNGGC